MQRWDGRYAPLGRSVRTVGDFTDGHGRAVLAAFSGLAVRESVTLAGQAKRARVARAFADG